MKNLGGISIDIVDDGEHFQCAIGVKMNGAPDMVVAASVATLIMKLTETNPSFPELLKKEFGKILQGEIEVEGLK